MEDRMNDIATLREKFIALLHKGGNEQEFQEFIEKNTALVPREFIQNHGVHLDLVFRKLSLGNDYTTDFFYLSKSSADWNCILIEIEKPQSRYFKDASNELHRDFHAALDQIDKWRAWFSNRSNFDGFMDGTIGLLRMPGGMGQNPCNVKYVLVHGQRTEFEGNEIRKSLIRAKEENDFHILSYDSLLESLHSKAELYLARKKNEYIEILSNRFISDALFALVDPSYIKITDELRQSILDNAKTWRHYSVSALPGRRLVLENVLPKIGSIRIRPDALTSED